jgi:hypothetical protein
MLIQQKRLMTLEFVCTVSVECGIPFMFDIQLDVNNPQTLFYKLTAYLEELLEQGVCVEIYIYLYILLLSA